MAKRIPVRVKVSMRQQASEEQVRFEQAIDRLIGELVENEFKRRDRERADQPEETQKQPAPKTTDSVGPGLCQ